MWINGERTGAGILSLINGEKYGILYFLIFIFLSLIFYFVDGLFLKNNMHGSGWWKFPNGRVKPGEWKDDKLVRWTGPEQSETQMRAQRIKARKQ